MEDDRALPEDGQASSSDQATEASRALSLGARLMTLANLMRRITTSRFNRSFDLTLVEGWVISRLGLNSAISLDELAWQNGLAKSQTSKSVKGLVERGLVERKPAERGGLALTLTVAGQAIFDEFVDRAPYYNQLLATGLSEAALNELIRSIEVLTENSRRNLASELTLEDDRL